MGGGRWEVRGGKARSGLLRLTSALMSGAKAAVGQTAPGGKARGWHPTSHVTPPTPHSLLPTPQGWGRRKERPHHLIDLVPSEPSSAEVGQKAPAFRFRRQLAELAGALLGEGACLSLWVDLFRFDRFVDRPFGQALVDATGKQVGYEA